MAFTNNRNVFYNNKSFDEKLFANGLGMGTPSFVCKGLELTGTTLTSGVFNNTGAFGILGLEGETHTIPANYTGFIVIKTTMNSQNGFNEIITSTTKLDTDQRDTSNIKHFTIYQLNNGTIVQDFRHINYVKSFYLKNMGGSNIAWVLNGFTSETFDASVLAGNRTLINDFDIAYDDTIHGASELEDILLDIFTKGQTNVGNDKPWEVSWRCTVGSSPNLDTELDSLILSKTGRNVSGLAYMFKMQVGTSVGLSSSTVDVTNKVCLEYIDGSVYEFIFDYDNFANVKVQHMNLKQHWSLDELGLDGTWSLTDVPGNIKKAVDKVVSLIGNKTPFTITQPLYRNSSSTHYEFSQAIEDSIVTGYGKGIGTTGLEFRLTMGLTNGAINQSGNLGNFIEIIGNNNVRFIRLYNFTNWDDGNWIDEKGYIKGVGTQLYASGGNNEANITLSDSLLNYDRVAIRWYADTEHVSILDLYSQADDNVEMHRLQDTKGMSYFDGADWYAYTDILAIQIVSGTSLAIVESGKYAVRVLNNTNGTSDVLLNVGYGILEITGLNKRATPRTNIGLLNIPLVGDNMQDTNEVITND